MQRSGGRRDDEIAFVAMDRVIAGPVEGWQGQRAVIAFLGAHGAAGAAVERQFHRAPRLGGDRQHDGLPGTGRGEAGLGGQVRPSLDGGERLPQIGVRAGRQAERLQDEAQALGRDLALRSVLLGPARCDTGLDGKLAENVVAHTGLRLQIRSGQGGGRAATAHDPSPGGGMRDGVACGSCSRTSRPSGGSVSDRLCALPWAATACVATAPPLPRPEPP